jgi:hypothetical protein
LCATRRTPSRPRRTALPSVGTRPCLLGAQALGNSRCSSLAISAGVRILPERRTAGCGRLQPVASPSCTGPKRSSGRPAP